MYEQFSQNNHLKGPLDNRSPAYKGDGTGKGPGSAKKKSTARLDDPSNRTLELYKSFMQSYVKRINDSTFKVTIGGIRIGSAKYSRLAQINLKSRIITFSRFAIENVPERGRRYLVLHELAHVLEASHNKHFWNLVEYHEPEYHEIGVALDRAFKKNVQKHERGHHVDPGPLPNASTIWTPDHGFVELGNKSLGLHRDPLRSFNRNAGPRYIDEAYSEYLELREGLSVPEYSEQHAPHTNLIYPSHSHATTTASLINEAECFSEDEGYFDDLFGTMSGGDE